MRWKRSNKFGCHASGQTWLQNVDHPRLSEPENGCSQQGKKLIFSLQFFKQKRVMFCTAKGSPPLLNSAVNRPNGQQQSRTKQDKACFAESPLLEERSNQVAAQDSDHWSAS
jgi:hypothetical protein